MGITNTRMILAFLLAISDLQEDLTADEKDTLVDIGEKLVTPSDPLIKKSLIAIIQKNASLNQRYQELIFQINNIDDDSLQEFIETTLTTLKQQSTKGYFDGNPDLVSYELMNVTVLPIIRNKESVTEIKKSGFLDKFDDFIHKYKLR